MWRLFFPRLQLSPTMSICYFIYITRIQSKNKKKKSSTVQISYTKESIWGVLLTLLQAAEGEGEGPNTDTEGAPLLGRRWMAPSCQEEAAGKGAGLQGRVGEVLAAGCRPAAVAAGAWQMAAERRPAWPQAAARCEARAGVARFCLS
jgi:hypothetical protein